MCHCTNFLLSFFSWQVISGRETNNLFLVLSNSLSSPCGSFFFFYITFPPYFLSNCGHIFFFDSLLNSIKASFHGYFPWLRFISRYTGISWCNILLVAIIQRIVLRFKEKECFSKIEFHPIYASLSKISSNGLFSCYKVF